MPISDALLSEFDHEFAVMRRVLERVPLTAAQWKPHAKSMSMGELAMHVVEIPLWVHSIAGVSVLDLAGMEAPDRTPFSSTEQMLAGFDERTAAARQAIAKLSDPDMLSSWTLKKGEQEMLKLPRIAVLRSFVMNHMIHHRGQLSVYLRLKDVPVPSIYGPSADEGSM